MTPATIETVEQLDLARAKALCVHGGNGWHEVSNDCKVVYVGYAKALRESDERAGLITVPREPTEKMCDAADYDRERYGHIATNRYRAMLRASPFAKEGGE
jgi:hypothetical protein